MASRGVVKGVYLVVRVPAIHKGREIVEKVRDKEGEVWKRGINDDGLSLSVYSFEDDGEQSVSSTKVVAIASRSLS